MTLPRFPSFSLPNLNTISHLEFMSYIKYDCAEIYVLHKLKVAGNSSNRVKFMSYINLEVRRS